MPTEHEFETYIAAHGTDSILKERARLAFAAYEDAIVNGEIELAEAAHARFLAASAIIMRGTRL